MQGSVVKLADKQRRFQGKDLTKARTGYRFREKDPLLEEIIKLLEQTSLSYSEIARRSGVSLTTLTKWRYGRTFRPQRLTMEYVLNVIGYELRIVERSSK